MIKVRSRFAAAPFIGLMSLLIWLVSPVYAQQQAGDITVDAEGIGTSQKDATLKAKREAVETGIGTVLISQTEIKNYELQKDVILTRTLGSVKSYELLEEIRKPDMTVFVKIRATVSLAGIKEDLAALKILLESMDKPRMMVVVEEAGGHGAESAIVDYLNSKEFELVDPAVVAALMKKESDLVNRAAAGDPAAAARIGSENGAEFILAGRVTKSAAGSDVLKGTGLISGQASIAAKVINCSNAKIIAAKTAQSAAAHLSAEVAAAMAAEKAGRKLMDAALFEAIVASFQDTLNNGLPLDITIEPVSSYKQQKALQGHFRDIEDVVSVNKRSYGNGRLKLTVFFKGSADSFSDAVDGTTFMGKTLSVIEVEGSRIGIQLN
ncbi:MAG: hypothetical protein AMJ54_07760 [Deltaproteobacteria bacterium SG8_13]|nr:MAG: hypothetical protein AMJ54_07760 [Deltaproteobacteria bacterium SG8_13]